LGVTGRTGKKGIFTNQQKREQIFVRKKTEIEPRNRQGGGGAGSDQNCEGGGGGGNPEKALAKSHPPLPSGGEGPGKI